MIGAWLLWACAPSVANHCRDEARCAGWDAASEEQCVDRWESARALYDDVGCSAPYDALLRCVDRHATCEDATYVRDDDACAEDIEAAEACRDEKGDFGA